MGHVVISKGFAVLGVILAAGAVATIIALSVVYSEEKAKNANQVAPTAAPTGAPTGAPTSGPTTPSPPKQPWEEYRLPKSLIPERYDVLLWPRLTPDASTGLYIFTGNSSVEFQCVEDTDLILIHSNKLNYTTDPPTVGLASLGQVAAPSVKKTWLQDDTEYLVIQLNGKLINGQRYRLSTEFQGELADDLGGFYRSVYKENGQDRVVATTQMQPTDARKAFPCFDEPAMKAIFYITLIHDKTKIALSNGEQKESVSVVMDGQNVMKTTFEPTKKMSTYLLAFIVSDFGSINETIGDVLIRIFARQSAINADQGKYALNVTGPILKFFEKYYNSTYPLPKSDQVALPDFNAGAMENWGLITYRETALLYDTDFSSNSNKQRIATIIAHELAHMWFGNLVTMRWWNDLWLNEGFASYVEYLGADSVEPDWNVKDLIVLSDVHRVFAIDALTSSHPLSSKEEAIQTPAEINELFDAISYSKGASVLRMLSNFLTERVFQLGLWEYLDKYAYSNAVYSNLWAELQGAVNKSGTQLPDTVENIMNTWVLQMGYPVVTINTTTGEVTQKHFLLDPEGPPPPASEFNYQWIVPIQWMKGGKNQTIQWLTTKSGTFEGMKTTGNEWVLGNHDVEGYYRVNYDDANWERLLTALANNHETIPVINRAQLVDDAFNMARAKIISTELALRTTLYLNEERQYMPWESAVGNLDFFYLMFDRNEVYGPMQDYLRSRVTPLFQHFEEISKNWTTVPVGHMDQYTQVIALSLACRTGLQACVDQTKSMFAQWMADSNYRIHPNLRSTVYCNGIAAGGAKEWDHAWSVFLNATVASEAEKLRAALACTKQPWLINRYLKYTLDPTLIRKQDATSTIIYIANNVVGQPLAWDFMRSNWNYIFTQYGGGSFSFSNLINGVTERFSTSFELHQLKQFRIDNAGTGFGSGALALNQSIERTEANIKWISENQPSVMKWFGDNTPK